MPSLLPPDKEAEIVKNLKVYGKRYEEEDEAITMQADADVLQVCAVVVSHKHHMKCCGRQKTCAVLEEWLLVTTVSSWHLKGCLLMRCHLLFMQERQKMLDEWNAWLESRIEYVEQLKQFIREQYDTAADEEEYTMETVTVEQILDSREEPYNPNM